MVKRLEKSTPETRRAMLLERSRNVGISERPKNQIQSVGSNPAVTTGQWKISVAAPQCSQELEFVLITQFKDYKSIQLSGGSK